MSLHDVLAKAGKPDLVAQMSKEELQRMIDSSSGFMKYLFARIKRKRIE